MTPLRGDAARGLGRVVAALIATLTLVGMLTAMPYAQAAATRTGQEHYDEWDFIDRVNAARSAAGLSALRVVSTLREGSRDHSERMAAAGSIFHDEDLKGEAERVSSCWSRVGENVSVGGSVPSIHDAFMRSSGHRAVILGDFQYVGIGVESRNGRLWVTERFIKLGSGCSLPTVSKPVFHWVDVDLTGSGDGTVTSSPSGLECGADCREPYTAGTGVTLTAAAATGSVFRGWSGGGCSGTNTCTLTMDQTRSVTALFVARHLLTVSATGSGSGSITGVPSGIDCGVDCSETLDEGTQVTLVATPDEGSVFRGWTGAACSGDEQCTFSIAAPTNVVATFIAQHDLDVSLTGSGDGAVISVPEGIDCGSECIAPFDEGTEVTLVAISEDGSVFRGWSGGGCFGTDDCTITMEDARSVTATFVAQHDLDVYTAGTGNGKITSSPGGIRCGSDCFETFDEGIDVVLTATPNRWSRFVRWRGACAGAGQRCVLTIDRSRSVTAVFDRRRR